MSVYSTQAPQPPAHFIRFYWACTIAPPALVAPALPGGMSDVWGDDFMMALEQRIRDEQANERQYAYSKSV